MIPPESTTLAPAMAEWLEGVRNPAMAAVELSLLLVLGRTLGDALGLRHWGLPEALLAGVLGLVAVTSGPVDLVPEPVVRLWAGLPTALLTLVFATLLLGKPLPRLRGLWRPVSAQMLLALTLAFGQYLVGAAAVLFLLGPWLGVHPLMACLIEAAYEGGHGSAAAMGPHFARLGFAGGASLGLAMATVGLLASTMVGVVLVVVARWRGWLLSAEAISTEAIGAEAFSAKQNQGLTTGLLDSPQPPRSSAPDPEFGLGAWAANLVLAGMAVGLGWGLLQLLRYGAQQQGGGLSAILEAMPAFPLALAGSLLVRLTLDRSGHGRWASARIQNRLGTVAADLLITAATASLDLTLLEQDWLPLTLLAALGLGWNVLVLLLLAPRVLPAGWFERGITEFGQATGVVASGLLLLRMADPQDRSDALTAFSIKQLVLQPLLAGGVITVLAPIAVSSWGLERWMALCLALVSIWIGLGLVLGRSHPSS